MGLAQLFRRESRPETAVTSLYRTLVAKARTPVFYTDLNVPDTIDGRFDMMVIHAMIIFRRLRGEGKIADRIAQELLDLMFSDMDRSLREMGIGDMNIGKHVKRMAKAFYGRAEMYEAGIDGDAATMNKALIENLYRHTPPAAATLAEMGDYLRRAAAHIAAQPVARVIAGEIDWDVAVR